MASCDCQLGQFARQLPKMKFAIIAFPFTTDSDAGTAAGPGALLKAGLIEWLQEQGHRVSGPFAVELTYAEQAAYGAWNRISLANAHLSRLVSREVREKAFPLILQSNCYAAIAAPRHGMDRRAWRLQHARDDSQRMAQRHAGGHRSGAVP